MIYDKFIKGETLLYVCSCTCHCNCYAWSSNLLLLSVFITFWWVLKLMLCDTLDVRKNTDDLKKSPRHFKLTHIILRHTHTHTHTHPRPHAHTNKHTHHHTYAHTHSPRHTIAISTHFFHTTMQPNVSEPHPNSLFSFPLSSINPIDN